jgi:hypothetical protein
LERGSGKGVDTVGGLWSSLRPVCSGCGSDEVVPIIYGLPAPPLLEAEQRGDVVLSSCVSFTDLVRPRWHCKGCKNEWPGWRVEKTDG